MAFKSLLTSLAKLFYTLNNSIVSINKAVDHISRVTKLTNLVGAG